MPGRIQTVSLAVVVALLLTFLDGKDESSGASTMPNSVKWAPHGPTASLLNVNNFHLWIDHSGRSPYQLTPSSMAGEYPPGKGVIFSDGILLGGIVHDGGDTLLRIIGGTYASGLKAGRVLTDSSGNVIGSEAPATRHVWRVRPDFRSVDLTDDAAAFLAIDPGAVTDTNIQSIYNQYEYDWRYWPVGEGAPFEDVDQNSSYDPDIDIPGEPGADQTIWLVANDLPYADGRQVSAVLFDSPPIGLEFQLTLWTRDLPGVSPGEVVFKRVRIIYTGLAGTPGTATIDSMYIAQWSDPDIGTYTNDFAGWDHDLNLAYAYNASEEQEIYHWGEGNPSVAVGYCSVQGPILAGTTILPAAFNYVTGDPYDSGYDRIFWYYNFMRGYRPRPVYPAQEPLIDPMTDEPTRYVLSGDPVIESGWIDGIELHPGDRRFLLSYGPASMALGDTVELVMATVATRGVTHLDAVPVLRKATKWMKTVYDLQWHLSALEVQSRFISNAETEVGFRIKTDMDIISANASIRDTTGTPVTAFPLLDDGAHNDGLMGDFVFGNHVALTPGIHPFSLDLELSDGWTTYSTSNAYSITTGGPLVVDTLLVVSDHLNEDGLANPGENVHLSPIISNRGSFTYRNLWAFIHLQGPIDSQEEFRIVLPDLSPGQTSSMLYDITDALTYTPAQVAGIVAEHDSIWADVEIVDEYGNCWQETVVLPIPELPQQIGESFEMRHVAGTAWGSFNYRIFDQFATFMDHEYELTISNPDGGTDSSLLSIRDLTEGTVLLEHVALPDDHAHNIPITDGFKVTKGNIVYEFDRAVETVGEPWVEVLDIYPAGWWSLTPEKDMFSVELRFQHKGEVSRDGYASRGAVYWSHQDDAHAGTGKLPFKAWELDQEGGRLRQVNVSFWEDDDPGMDYPPANLIWDMGWYGIAPHKADRQFPPHTREHFVIHASDYDKGQQYDDDNYAECADIAWDVWPQPVEDRPYLYSAFSIYLLAKKPPAVQDVYRFKPAWRGGPTPEAFIMCPNYPNPFNTTTRIEYGLPTAAQVDLVIYDLLGRQVTRLLGASQESGRYSLVWNGLDQYSRPLPSGIYIARLVTPGYANSIKMLLLK